MPQIIGGNLRAIGTASAKRDEVLPDVPTLDEQGYRDVYADNWYALTRRRRRPAAVIAKLNSAFTAALKDPEVGKKLLEAGAVPAPTTPEELGEILKSDLARWGTIIKGTSGIKRSTEPLTSGGRRLSSGRARACARRRARSRAAARDAARH